MQAVKTTGTIETIPNPTLPPIKIKVDENINPTATITAPYNLNADQLRK